MVSMNGNMGDSRGSRYELYDSREAKPGSIMISDVIATALRLREIIEEETRGLMAMEFEPLSAYMSEKQTLLDRLERQKKLILYNRDVLAPYSEEEKRDLELVNRALEQSLTENALQLLKAREVNRMVIQAIADEVVRQVGKSQGYNKKGRDAAVASAKHIVPPMQVDKVV